LFIRLHGACRSLTIVIFWLGVGLGWWEFLGAHIIQVWQDLDLTVLKCILTSVSHTIEEFCVLTSRDSVGVVQVNKSEDVLHSLLARGQIDLRGDVSTYWLIVRFLNIIKVAVLQSLETKLHVGEKI